MMRSGRRGWMIWGLVLGAMFCLQAMGAEAVNLEKQFPAEGYWLPEAASTFAPDIDGLFYGILWLTTFVFIVTEALLLIFIIKYRKRDGERAIYTHGNHKLEMIWTITPAVILAIIAFVQKGTWDKVKQPTSFPKENVINVQLFAEQFTWNFRYPGKDNKWGTADDITTSKQLYVPVDRPIVIEQTSKDVIHSLFLPYMRLKQDVVPGMQIKTWFHPLKTTQKMQAVPGRGDKWNYEIVCAELCGIQHAQMRGEMYVLEQKDYDAWVEGESKKFEAGSKEQQPIWEHWKMDGEGNRVWPKKAEAEKKEEGHH